MTFHFNILKKFLRGMCDYCLGRRTRMRRNTDWGHPPRPGASMGHYKADDGTFKTDRRKPPPSIDSLNTDSLYNTK